MSLIEYNRKRKFDVTREPKGKKGKTKKPIFVIQEHHASHLHYDFRLEMNGVLKSWAVPKGPPTKAKDKRLAVEVEDHPITYAKFHGDIPEGQYGAGHVEIWDEGFWETSSNPLSQLKKGHIDIELHGDRLQGHWTLVRTSMKAKKANWLLIKRSDDSVIKEAQKEKPLSLPTLPKQKLPAFVEPQLCTLTDDAPTGKDWVHEIKFDGYRTLAHLQGAKTKLLTRSGLDWSKKYRHLLPEFKKLKVKSALIDGEIVWVNEEGKSEFDGLQEALQEDRSEDLLFYAFDLIHLDGRDLSDLPLIQRKELLEDLLKKSKTKKIIYSHHQTASGEKVLEAACQLDLEGIIAKNAQSIYQPGRGHDWLKIKCKHVQEFVIGGYTLQKNSHQIGSLLMGYYEEGNPKVLRYIGKVGTGFNQKNSAQLLKKLKSLKSDDSPFSRKLPSVTNFVKPQLVAQIEFGAWTKEKILRHAVFKGLREDKKAKDVHDEARIEKNSKPKKLERKTKITHEDKILYPKAKVTKLEVVQYYEAIQDRILPYLVNRPLSLLRCPEGVNKTCFFQKHLAGNDKLIHLDSLDEVIELIQINTLELHTRNTNMDHLDLADQIVFDLDPDKGVSWAKVKEAAMTLKGHLDQLGLKSFLKVSGNKGLHIHVPLKPLYKWDQIKEFTRSLCLQMAETEPDKYTVNLLKKNRKGKIFLDYLRNQEQATAVVPYSVRKTEMASVALPITWNQLKDLKAPDQFTLKKTNWPALLKKTDPWKDYFKSRQRIKILDQINRPLSAKKRKNT